MIPLAAEVKIHPANDERNDGLIGYVDHFVKTPEGVEYWIVTGSGMFKLSREEIEYE